ncbi:MAG TPA: hypothetical protein VN625_01640, partial [Desulfuromonadaceae bacterium]|nr:hypothetical protein [Desulfuromonadaceae bacterium]
MGAEPSSPIRKTPPLLLGATLLFWGWQSNLLVAAAVMALILEGARLVSIRWDLTEADFRRIWNFSSLLAITVAIYAFTSSDEGNISSIFHGGPGALRTATLTTARTASTFLRWLPLVFFLAVAAQVYSVRETMPLTAVSLWLRRRRDREIKAGRKITPVADINITYGYFIICIFSAGIHINEGSESFFWGQCVLFAWALWPFRAKRYRLIGSFLAFAVVVGFAFYTQFGVRYIQHALEGYNARWMSRLFHPATDPEQSMTAIGQLGLLKLSGAIVIRLHTPDGAAPPTYLREASYRGYYSANPRWYSIPRSNFSQVYSETNQTTWILQPHKTNSDTVNIACYLNSRSRESGSPKGLLPLPVDSHRLENFDAYILQKNLEGAVLAEGPHLLIFDALYGTGSTIDAPPDTSTSATNLDLLVPTNEIPA